MSINTLVVYGPYWLHLKESWSQRNNPNLHFMFYEDLKQNTLEELKRLNDFLGTKLSQEQLENVRSSTFRHLIYTFFLCYIFAQSLKRY